MATTWEGMRNHHSVNVRVSDEHFLYLHAKKARGVPITEVIRQALAEHIASERGTQA